MAVYTTIDNPELYMQVKAYSGNGTAIGSGGLSVTLDGDENMQPDMIYFKRRDSGSAGQIQDAIRGVTKFIPMDGSTDAQETNAETLTAYNSDGFTVGNHNGVNNGSGTYAAWCWKTGSAFSNDASATSVGNTDSSGSVNATSKFSIAIYEGAGASLDIQVKHGLSAVPAVMWTINLDDANHRAVYHHKNTSAPETDFLYLSDDRATTDDADMWNDTAPTSAVFTAGDHSSSNRSGDSFVSYHWNEVQGYSKFGSYTGNGNTNGTFVYTGFRPSLVIVKISSGTTGSWCTYSSKVLGYNDDNDEFLANDPGVPGVGNNISIYSNGFKMLKTTAETNGSGNSFVYMAWAEAPFVNSKGVPCNAR